MSSLLEFARERMKQLREYWRSLPPEKKEGTFFLPLHVSIAYTILKKLREQGITLVSLITEKPSLVLAGIAGGALYASILGKILEQFHQYE